MPRNELEGSRLPREPILRESGDSPARIDVPQLARSVATGWIRAARMLLLVVLVVLVVVVWVLVSVLLLDVCNRRRVCLTRCR